MVKPVKFAHLHLVYQFTIPLASDSHAADNFCYIKLFPFLQRWCFKIKTNGF